MITLSISTLAHLQCTRGVVPPKNVDPPKIKGRQKITDIPLIEFSNQTSRIRILCDFTASMIE